MNIRYSWPCSKNEHVYIMQESPDQINLERYKKGKKMSGTLNSHVNTIKLFPGNHSCSQSDSSTSSTQGEDSNSSDSDIGEATPQVKEDVSQASVAFNVAHHHGVLSELMKRTENDPSKSVEEEEEVKSKPKGSTSAGNEDDSAAGPAVTEDDKSSLDSMCHDRQDSARVSKTESTTRKQGYCYLLLYCFPFLFFRY